jgi:hypothetical protein
MCASHPRRAERNRTGRRPVGIYGVTAPAKGGSVTASKAQRDVDFADFFAATWPRLLRTPYAVTGDRQLAEDTLQSAFAKAYAAWARVSGADDPVAYVRRIAINVALQHHRRASTRRESVVEHTPEQPERPREDDLLAHDEEPQRVRGFPSRKPRNPRVVAHVETTWILGFPDPKYAPVPVRDGRGWRRSALRSRR